MAALLFPLRQTAPAALSVLIPTPDPTLDLTTVTAVHFSVLRQTDGVTVSWTASIAGGATPTEMVANYTFAADGSDFPVTGPYWATPVLTLPGGSIQTPVIDIFVLAPAQYHATNSPQGY